MGASGMIRGILASEADQWWPRVDHWIVDALSYSSGLLSLEDVKSAVRDRNFQLWVVEGPKAVCITEIRVWPQGKCLTVILLGGENMAEWISELDEVLVRFAKSNECKVMDCHGRKGWGMKLKSLGFSESLVTYFKEVI